jgi:hypothetical protein
VPRVVVYTDYLQINSSEGNTKSTQVIINNIVLIGKPNDDTQDRIIISKEKMEQCINYQMTYAEISDMKINEKMKFDRRNPFRYFFDLISVSHALVDTFYVRSALHPRSFKIILFFLQISFQFMLNGIFYSDKIIEERRVNQKQSTVDASQATLSDTIRFEISQFPSKMLPSIFFSVCITYLLMTALMEPATNIRKLYNEKIISRKDDYVQHAMYIHYNLVMNIIGR